MSSVCEACKKEVSDGGLKAMGGVWHSDCFVCKKCGGGFESSFVNIKGSPFHEGCTEKDEQTQFTPCGTCGREIEEDEAVRVKGVDYHKGKCFACHKCGKALTESFSSVDGHVYCSSGDCSPVKVVERGTRDAQCDECSKIFVPEDSLVRAEGRTYHAECWKCAACRKPISKTQPFVMEGGKPYHKDTACLPEDLRKTCFKCMKLIDGPSLELDGGKRVMHPDCWVCIKCKGRFTEGYVETDEGPCHAKGECR